MHTVFLHGNKLYFNFFVSFKLTILAVNKFIINNIPVVTMGSPEKTGCQIFVIPILLIYTFLVFAGFFVHCRTEYVAWRRYNWYKYNLCFLCTVYQKFMERQKNKQIYTKTIFRKFTTILFILKNGEYCIYTYKGRNVDLYMIVIYLYTTVIHCQKRRLGRFKKRWWITYLKRQYPEIFHLI